MNFFKTKFNKKIISLGLIGIFSLSFVGLLPQAVFADQALATKLRANANKQLNGVTSDYNRMVKDFWFGVAHPLKTWGDPMKTLAGEQEDSVGPSVWLVQKASDFLMWTVSEELYDEVFFSKEAKAGVTQAWEAVRGFINMFYLLILIFLAITTILQINKFNDKKLFFNVIVSAILVNFSMAITLVVIDFSNLIMVYFASAIHDINLGNFFFDKMGYAKNILVNPDSTLLTIGTNMIGFIINIITAVMLFFVGISLLIRLIAYWVLIILSPLAFFSIAVPGSNGFQEWKDKLINYSFYGPIMLFFIWLSMALSTYLNNAFQQASGIEGTNGFVKFLTSYITVIYLLYYGHDKSKAMAKKAGDTVGMLMDKGGQYAVTAGKGAALATGVGAAGYFGGKYLYTGMKARAGEGKYTRLLTKEGRKKSEEEFKRSAEKRFASSGKRESMDFQQASTTIDDWKKSGKDIDNEDFLKDKLVNGNKKEQQAAMVQLATLGKLGKKMKDKDGVERSIYDIAKQKAGSNKFFNKALDRSAGKNSEAAMLEYYTKEYNSSNPSDESKTFIMRRMKGLIKEYNRINPGSAIDEKDAVAVDGFMKSMFAGTRRRKS